MATNEKTRILWISDLHFNDSIGRNKFKIYDKRQLIKNQCNKLTEEIKNTHIDYVLFSGDIAFGGERKDYELFNNWLFNILIDTIKKVNKSVKVIAVPGNHDINWERLDGEYIGNLECIKTYNFRNDFLANNYDKAKQNFSAYSQFLKENDINKDINLHLEEVDRDRIGNLFGIIKDREKNIIFVLINSAWFSLGAKANELIKDYVIRNQSTAFKKYEKLKYEQDMLVKYAIDIKDLIGEYGNQIVGQKMLREAKINKALTELDMDNATIVTIMHHPPNWLHWNERFDISEKSREDSEFKKILHKSNLLLSGHEHVPGFIPPEAIDDELKHLKATSFLEELQNDEMQNITHNGYSILEINNNDNKLTWELKNFKFHYPNIEDVCIESYNDKIQQHFRSKLFVDPDRILKKLKNDTIVESNTHPVNRLEILKQLELTSDNEYNTTNDILFYNNLTNTYYTFYDDFFDLSLDTSLESICIELKKKTTEIFEPLQYINLVSKNIKVVVVVFDIFCEEFKNKYIDLFKKLTKDNTINYKTERDSIFENVFEQFRKIELELIKHFDTIETSDKKNTGSNNYKIINDSIYNKFINKEMDISFSFLLKRHWKLR